MLVAGGQVLWSASDLTAATGCEYAVLRRLDIKLGWVESTDEAPDPLAERIADLGNRHEAVELDRLRAEFGAYDPATGGGAAEIDRPRPYTPDVLRQRQADTFAALRAGADVVYQGAFFDGRFHGFADFLVRDGGAYRVCDAKLARNEQPKALLQLAAYADQLDRAGIPLDADAELLLGSGRRVRYPLAEIAPVFGERRARLVDLLDRHRAGEQPLTWGAPQIMACGRCEVCAAEVEAHRDLLLVAGMRATQRRRLRDAGVTTIDQLATHDGPVDQLAAGTLARLRAQAALQVRQTHDSDGRPHVLVDVFAPDQLRTIPPPSVGDLFFDFEGDPLWTDGNADDWGLEYLFGVTEPPTTPGGSGHFRAFWAHDRPAEKRALEDFFGYVRERRAAHSDMHIYHYAAYEKAALTRLAIRHATCEDEVDDLLRAGVLVDLYAVVCSTIRVSQPSYSIKQFEPLYMGDDPRSGRSPTRPPRSWSTTPSARRGRPAARGWPTGCWSRSATTTSTTATARSRCATGCWPEPAGT
ncbi:MAG: TM0106 family RecB-like putative nuclease, partial [Actinomycetota bacterium]|nr:TM0106 family RecB-like putative nuclease [Actinomycetota bacterium]